jgi:hypothetical protein
MINDTGYKMSLEQATVRAARLARRIGFAVVQQRHDGGCNVLTSIPGSESDMCRHWPVNRDGTRIDYVSAQIDRRMSLRHLAWSARQYDDARALERLRAIGDTRELMDQIAREWGLT